MSLYKTNGSEARLLCSNAHQNASERAETLSIIQNASIPSLIIYNPRQTYQAEHCKYALMKACAKNCCMAL
jgi:hypothetical protein